MAMRPYYAPQHGIDDDHTLFPIWRKGDKQKEATQSRRLFYGLSSAVVYLA
jgi:hypothetical protein